MSYKTLLSGQVFTFDSVKEVLAKANEEKSGDILAGIAAKSGWSASPPRRSFPR